MIAIRACATPKPEAPKVALPKRLTRARRVMESKRLDSFREIHEALKKTAHDETEFVKGFFNTLNEPVDDTETDAEPSDE